MSVAAVMLVKDEADILGYTIEHLLGQVDAVFVLDNLSTDGTSEILAAHSEYVWWALDDEVAYHQAEKTTRLARMAYDKGFDWVVPCDADELWRCRDPSRRIGDALDKLPSMISFVQAELYDHKVTALDPAGEENPFRRIGYRFKQAAPLPKVAVRLSDDVEIEMGNHGARRGSGMISSSGRGPVLDDLLVVEHYSWRSEEQFVRKIRNGYRAYEASDLDADFGKHWRMFGDPDGPDFDEQVRWWFRQWAYSEYPDLDPTIGYFPAPIG